MSIDKQTIHMEHKDRQCKQSYQTVINVNKCQQSNHMLKIINVIMLSLVAMFILFNHVSNGNKKIIGERFIVRTIE